ncbi:MAG TPA: VOC family protein [Aeromicrobium sp.]|nr:VOC family protein [Aeromicrobium sp.]
MPIGHLGLNVYDLPAAKAYFDALMPQVSFEPFISDERQFSYRPAGGKIGTTLFFYSADQPGFDHHNEGLQHIAFMVKTRAAVHDVFAWAMEQGGTAVREPQELPQYHPGYYAAFWTDPRGFLLEVVCHRDVTEAPTV